MRAAVNVKSFGMSALALVLLGGVLAGCGDSDKKDDKASQVLAKVNDSELTVHQVNHALSRQGAAAGAPEAMQAQVLEKLIDRELMLQKAEELKLDRKPEVQIAIEEARREIIANAYVSSLVGTPVKPTSEQVSAYYNANPGLFAQRKVYRMNELIVSAEGGFADGAQQRLGQGQSLEAVVGWLKEQNAKFSAKSGVRAAEQLPIALLPKLLETKPGQAVAVKTGAGLIVYQVIAMQDAPIDLAKATPAIEQFLVRDQVSKTVAEAVKGLRAAAKIEYVGRKPEDKPAEAAPETKPADAAQAGKPADATQDAVLKGVEGMTK